jgi:DNA-binding PadR family transcriptional regulator
MEQDGWVKAEWGMTEKNREARFYAITAAGRRQLAAERGRWERLVESIAMVLGPDPAEG